MVYKASRLANVVLCWILDHDFLWCLSRFFHRMARFMQNWPSDGTRTIATHDLCPVARFACWQNTWCLWPSWTHILVSNTSSTCAQINSIQFQHQWVLQNYPKSGTTASHSGKLGMVPNPPNWNDHCISVLVRKGYGYNPTEAECITRYAEVTIQFMYKYKKLLYNYIYIYIYNFRNGPVKDCKSVHSFLNCLYALNTVPGSRLSAAPLQWDA